MALEEIVHGVLTNDSQLASMVPSGRIVLRSQLRDIPLPFITHGPVAEVSLLTFDGPARRWVDSYQISVFASTHSQALAIAERIVALLGSLAVSGARMTYQGRRWNFEHDPVPCHHCAIEFEAVA